jgi:hypothetical protein
MFRSDYPTHVPTGSVDVVSVNGPKTDNIDPKKYMDRTAEETQFYQVVRIGRIKLSCESRTANGELFDSFEWAQSGRQVDR